MTRLAVGDLIREWRTRRRRSQLDLAIDVGVSTRHLSFVETGRSRPSPELVLALAHHLDVPLRERNTMLLAAGYAPRFSHRALDDASMAGVRASLQRMLDAHLPYPGLVVDRRWNMVLANEAALLLTVGVDPALLADGVNVYRLTLHEAGLAPRLLNLAEVANTMLEQLRSSVAATGDPGLAALLAEVQEYRHLAPLWRRPEFGEPNEPLLLVPFRLETPVGEVRMFTTITTFGTPRDVTLEELAVELFFPADDDSARGLLELAEAAGLSSLRSAAAR